MKQLKPVENFSDVICENCTSYNEDRCYQELPDIPTESGNKCGLGNYLFKGEIINYRHICIELLPFGFVTDVQDLICKNCGYYDDSRQECHYQRLNIYKSSPDDWCNSGIWLYRDDEVGVILGSLSAAYEKFIKGKETEKSISKNKRLVKTIEVFDDVICENCISYKQRRCCFSLPSVPVSSDNNCSKGQWIHKSKLFNIHGISTTLVSHRLVQDIADLSCRECIFYNPSKEECHYNRLNIYKSAPNDWCSYGEWLYEDKIIGTSRSSLDFLYSKLTESKDK